MSILLLAAGLGCQPGTLPAAPAPAIGVPQLDLSLTGGHTEADHVEVAPGVFMLRELADSGQVTYRDLGIPEDGPISDPRDLPDRMPEEISPDSYGGTCWNYDYDVYSDHTSHGTLFGGDPSWYGYGAAYSYHYQGNGGTYDYDYASTYVYSQAPSTVDWIYTYAYVYIDGAYVGYVYRSASSSRYASAWGYWSTSCSSGGTLDVDVYTYHYIYDSPEWLGVGEFSSASVACCP